MLALMCLVAAFTFWRWRFALQRINRFMIQAERHSQTYLGQVPHQLLAGQAKIDLLQGQLRQLARYQQVLELLDQSLKIWRWRQRRFSGSRPKKFA
jgi:hypothetical protein